MKNGTVTVRNCEIDNLEPVFSLVDGFISCTAYGEIAGNGYFLQSDLKKALSDFNPRTDTDRLKFIEKNKLTVNYIFDIDGNLEYVDLYCCEHGWHLDDKYGFQSLNEAVDYLMDVEEIG